MFLFLAACLVFAAAAATVPPPPPASAVLPSSCTVQPLHRAWAHPSGPELARCCAPLLTHEWAMAECWKRRAVVHLLLSCGTFPPPARARRTSTRPHPRSGDTTRCRMTRVTLHSHVHYEEIQACTCSGPLLSSVKPWGYNPVWQPLLQAVRGPDDLIRKEFQFKKLLAMKFATQHHLD